MELLLAISDRDERETHWVSSFLCTERMEQLGSNAYNPVPNSIYNINIKLRSTEEFQILENDIISACDIDNDDINPLFVTCSFSNEALQINMDGYEMCTDVQLGTIDTEYETSHLYAIMVNN